MGRTAAGVRGMRIKDGTEVIALLRAADGELLFASERGYGKRTAAEEFSSPGPWRTGRDRHQDQNARNGHTVGVLSVNEGDDLMLISAAGTLVRISSDEVSCLGRNTQGVRLIRLDEDDRLVGVARLAVDEDDESEDEVETRR